MKPIKFNGSNRILTKPKDMTDKECSSLPIFYSDGKCFSKWKLSFWERIKIIFTGIIWLTIRGLGTQPPVRLSIKYPFQKGKDGQNESKSTELSK